MPVLSNTLTVAESIFSISALENGSYLATMRTPTSFVGMEPVNATAAI